MSQLRQSLQQPDRDITITLTDAQITRVVRKASASTGVTALLVGLNDPRKLRGAVLPLLDEQGYSRATLRALLVLAAFSADGTARELTSVAKQLELSPSATHRYAVTWMALGLLEQDPRSRRYRHALHDTESGGRCDAG
jgi:hypothetical protein